MSSDSRPRGAAPDLAVRVEGLSKVYRSYPKPIDRLREWVTRRRRHQPFQALRDVNFSLPQGESLGIVGENGAGKSTLLKVLSGVSRPTTGSVEVNGRIASILELGSGFHPEFSGRDNIRINAALLGLSESRVEERMPEILAFSELGEFIDRPVKVYSTGMTMRLAFSIATQVEPDVLIVDEALSVGDGYFQKKCMDRMIELVDAGTTLLFCTHAMYYLTSFCHQAIWLRGGEVAAYGPARDVVAQYERFLQGKTRDSEQGESTQDPVPQRLEAESPSTVDETPGVTDVVPELDGAVGQGARAGRIVDVRVCSAPGSAAAPGAGRLEIEVDIEASDLDERFRLGVGIDRADGTQILSLHSAEQTAWSGRSHFTVRCIVPELPILQGSFTVYTFLVDIAGLHVWDQHVLRDAFERTPDDYRIGLLELPYDFELLG